MRSSDIIDVIVIRGRLALPSILVGTELNSGNLRILAQKLFADRVFLDWCTIPHTTVCKYTHVSLRRYTIVYLQTWRHVCRHNDVTITSCIGTAGWILARGYCAKCTALHFPVASPPSMSPIAFLVTSRFVFIASFRLPPKCYTLTCRRWSKVKMMQTQPRFQFNVQPDSRPDSYFLIVLT